MASGGCKSLLNYRPELWTLAPSYIFHTVVIRCNTEVHRHKANPNVLYLNIC